MTSEKIYNVRPGGSLRGKIRVPGDKSISHRSVILGALADGITQVSGLLEGEDVLATVAAFKAMGIEITGPDNGRLKINGAGLHGLQAPVVELNMGNSGTAMRLIAGVLAGQRFDSRLTGDVSLNKRPMGRIIDPLTAMGAVIKGAGNGMPPLQITGGQPLKAINYSMPVASAQVKSAVLLAGLYAAGETRVTEPAPTRDHTERMLTGFGYPIRANNGSVSIQGGGKLEAHNIDVPADISSAAFFLVGASIANNSELLLQHVGINPTRVGIINILRLMGADLELINQRQVSGEPVADIRIRSSKLKGIRIPEDQVPLAIDEFPVLFIAAACADGETVLTGAEELRVKESDRIAVMAEGLRTLGIDIEETADGAVIRGGQLQGGQVHSHGDHRIAMALAMAALRATDPISITDCDNVNTSFPGFDQLAGSVGLSIDVE